MKIATSDLYRKWKMGDIVRIIDQKEKSEKQYEIVDCFPEYFPKTAVLEEIPEDSYLQECTVND